MRIAIFYELNVGGARRSANEFAKGLRELGHTADLYVIDPEQDKKEISFYDDVYFYQFIPKEWKGKDWKSKLYKDTVELFQLYTLHKKIANDIDSRKYDVVFLEPSKFTQAPFLLRLLKTKKVYYCQEPLRMVYEDIFAIPKNLDFFRYNYEKLNRWIRKTIDKSNISKTNTLLANSIFTQKNIWNAYKLKSQVCYMGVDTEKFYPSKSSKNIDVLYIGAYDFMDGYGLLEEGIKLIDFPIKTHILLREKKWISNDKILLDLYQRSKILFMAGLNEPFGLLPLEAMACGAVVVAVNEGGYKESVIQGKTGILLKRDKNEVAQTIKKLLKDTKTLQQMSNNARKRTEDYWDWKNRVKELESILLKTAKNYDN